MPTPRQLLESLIRAMDERFGDVPPEIGSLIEDARQLLTPQTQPTTQGEIMSRMFQVREQLRALSNEEKELNEQWHAMENLLIAKMDEHGATRVASPLGTAVLATNIVPKVTDWDAFYQHIKDNDAFHLLQRRVASAAYRESLEAKQEIPGLAPYEQRTINLRAA